MSTYANRVPLRGGNFKWNANICSNAMRSAVYSHKTPGDASKRTKEERGGELFI